MFKGVAWLEKYVYNDNDKEEVDCVDLHQRFEELAVSWRLWR